MNLDELCDEVNKILKDQKIMVADARTSSVVTPRNVRYYQTIGLLHLPVRRDGRAEYDKEHLDRLVEIKKAQHDGVSLDQLNDKQKRVDINPLAEVLRMNTNFAQFTERPLALNVLSDRSVDVSDFVNSSNSETAFGWSVHFRSAVLSGRGEPPTIEQVEAIRKVLDSPTNTEE